MNCKKALKIMSEKKSFLSILKRHSLFLISGISLIGILFSGYLTFTELSAQTCSLGGCQAILGLPTCAYGLVMYLLVFVISLLGKN